jgi:hypothetical protein
MKTPGWFIAGFCLVILVGRSFADPIDAGRYKLSVLAGTPGLWGSVDGEGPNARFDPSAAGIAVDKLGNIYVSEPGESTIRKITPEGIVSTLAGMAGQEGNHDGTGSEARFKQPQGLAVDGAGNIYVADTGNFFIRKISPDGVVTTLAGAVGNVEADEAGNVYVIETYPQLVIRRIEADGTLVSLRIPMLWDDAFYSALQVRVDRAGNLYVLSAVGWDNSEVVKLTPTGDGEYALNRLGPPFVWPEPGWWETRWAAGMALDAAGNLYLKYDGSIAKYSVDGTIEMREVAEEAGGYRWGSFAADEFGRLFVLPDELPLAASQMFPEWAGTIFIGDFDPNATGVAILKQPHDNSAERGNGVTFEVLAARAPMLNYQWYFNSTPIPGATASTLWLGNIQHPDAGLYSVVVDDGTDIAISRNATLVVHKRQ